MASLTVIFLLGADYQPLQSLVSECRGFQSGDGQFDIANAGNVEIKREEPFRKECRNSTLIWLSAERLFSFYPEKERKK